MRFSSNKRVITFFETNTFLPSRRLTEGFADSTVDWTFTILSLKSNVYQQKQNIHRGYAYCLRAAKLRSIFAERISFSKTVDGDLAGERENAEMPKWSSLSDVLATSASLSAFQRSIITAVYLKEIRLEIRL